jgi:hypothetical protein
MVGQYRKIEEVLLELEIKECFCQCSATSLEGGNWYYPFINKMKSSGINEDLIWEIWGHMHPCSQGWTLQSLASQGELRQEDVFHISVRDFLATTIRMLESGYRPAKKGDW